MAGVVLHHGSQHPVIGLRNGSNDDEIVVTVQHDAAYVYRQSTQIRQHTLLLGGGHAQFAAPVVYDAAQSWYVAAVRESTTNRCHLCTCSTSDMGPTPSFLNSVNRLELDGGVFSLHTLQQLPGTAAAGSCVVAVLKDGRVGCPDWSTLHLSHISSPTPNSDTTATTLASSHHGNTLCVITQRRPQDPATLQVFSLSPASSTGKPTLAGTHTLPRPIPNAVPVACACSARHALCFWSDNTLSCVELCDGRSWGTNSGQQASVPTIRQLKYGPLNTTNTTAAHTHAADMGVSQPSNGSTPVGKASSKSKKRKNANTPEPSHNVGNTAHAGVPVCSVVSDTQFVVLAKSKAVGGSSLAYAVVNAKFGRVQSHKHTVLDALPAGVQSAVNSMLMSSTGHQGMCSLQGELAFPVGGHVLVVQLELPPSGLASMVGLASSDQTKSTSKSESAGTTHAADGQTSYQIVWQEEPSSAVQSVVPVATMESLDIKKLMLDHLTAGVGDELELTVYEDESAPGGGSEDEVHAQQLMERLASGGDAATLQEACQFMLRCSREKRGYAGTLLHITATGLAQHSLWDDVGKLLTHCPVTNLNCVPDLIPLLLSGQQYQTLISVLRSASDLSVSTLADVLKHYTSTSTALKAARVKHRKGMIAAAERVVKIAEDNPKKARCQKQARCAAALVSDFTAMESIMHPLVSLQLDPSILGLALSSLSTSQAMVLLRYLGKWVHKYEHQLPGDVEHIKLKQPLMYPTFAQVVDWLLALLDVHMTKLSWNDRTGELLTNTRSVIGACMKASQKLLPLSGVLGHCQAGAPLPSLHVIPPSMYTVELLNLRVGDNYNVEQAV